MDPFDVPATSEAQDEHLCSEDDQVEVLALVCTVVADARTMCAALCTSSSARTVILAKCSGTLQLQLKPEVDSHNDITDTDKLEAVQRILQQTAWLAQYGRLVGQLQLRSAAGMQSADEMAWTSGLKPPLQLRCLQLLVSRPVPLLQQLDARHLIRLELTCGSRYDVISTLLPAALSRLTGLQQLSMTGSWRLLHGSIAAALAGMLQLTRLVLLPQLPTAALVQLPSQLVELQLTNPACDAAQLVAHVQALQQLQSLTLVYDARHYDFAPHAEAWASIPQLQQLDIDGGGWPGEWHLMPDVAVGIAAATSLTRLYCGGWTSGWADVDLLAMLSPLKRLQSLNSEGDSCDSLQSFKRLLCCNLTQLKSLTLDMPYPLPQLALAQVCLQATQLTELVLYCPALTDDHVAMIADSMADLQRLAIAGSDRLTSSGLASALASPNLPRLEQLATWGRELTTAQQCAAVVDSLADALPTVSIVVKEHREYIDSGFVGAYPYVVSFPDYLV